MLWMQWRVHNADPISRTMSIQKEVGSDVVVPRERCSKGLVYSIIFHYTIYTLFILTVVLSQILSRCFRDHTPGFRAMNIWQNCFRGAFPVVGKIRSKQPVIHIWYDASLLEIGQSATFAKLSWRSLAIWSLPSFRPTFASWVLSFAGTTQFKPK